MSISPLSPVPTENLDSSTDSPALVRVDLLEIVTRVNRINTLAVSAFSSSLGTAVSTIGSAAVDLLVDVDLTISADLTVPTNINLIKPNNGKLITVNSGKTLTINGPFDAGLYQAFSGSGAVTGLKEARPEWFPNGIDDAVASISSAGGTVYLDAGVYLTDGFNYKSKLNIVGKGKGVSIIRLNANTTADVITVPDSAILMSLKAVTVDGNASNNVAQGGNGITFGTTLVSSSGRLALYDETVSQEAYSYKYFSLDDVAASNCANDGIHLDRYNFQLTASNIWTTYNGNDGIYNRATNVAFKGIYSEKNGRCGIYEDGGNNRYEDGEINWNGQVDDTYGAVYITSGSARSMFSHIHTEDNYTNGFVNAGDDTIFIGCVSDSDGYDAALGSSYSGNDMTGFWNQATASRASFVGCKVANYHNAVLPGNSLYPLQYPYRMDAPVNILDITFPLIVANNPSTGNWANVFQYQTDGTSHAQSKIFTGGNGSIWYLDSIPDTAAHDATVSFFRNVNTSGSRSIYLYKGDGTSTLALSFNLAAGSIESHINGASIVLRSADGTRYGITVSNAGALVVTPL